MIDIGKLCLGLSSPSDHLRYGKTGEKRRGRAFRRPVVVWNTTRRCNLACVHCYSNSDRACSSDELSGREARAFIDDLARFGVPVLLLSGGEPLLRPDVVELAEYASAVGLRVAFSTNGTLIDRRRARELRDAGVAYVGVSLDGLGETNDRFRGVDGAFDRALEGMRACRSMGLKVGLRYTMTRANVRDIPGIFELIREESIPRACFYHLVYTGRGAGMAARDLDARQTRHVVDSIVDAATEMHARGENKEVLTVDNHADGPYLYLRMLREGDPRAERALELLRMNGGNSSGVGIGCVSWDGTVFPDQFWRTHPLGNVRERPFSEIWTDLSNSFLARLKDKQNHVKGRCAACRFLELCAGNFRARAEAVTGDPWASDPACYLTDEEIGVTARAKT